MVLLQVRLWVVQSATDLLKSTILLETIKNDDDTLLVDEEEKHERHFSMYAPAVFQLIIAVGIGTIFSKLLSLTGMTFPIYIGAMIAAAIMRNIGRIHRQNHNSYAVPNSTTSAVFAFRFSSALQ